MSFNFQQAFQEAKFDEENDKLALILMGEPTAGKSGTAATLGVKTLFLYTSGESHGPKSAKSFGKDVSAVCLDVAGGKHLTADESYGRLLAILQDVGGIKKAGFEAIILDSATEVENLIVNTSDWKTRVATAYKGVESFAGPVTLALFRPILDALKLLQRELGIHYVITCILNIKEYGDNGEILDAEPKLKGYDVATSLIQQIPDRLIIGQMSNGEIYCPRIQMAAGVSKSTKDFKTKEVRKTHNFKTSIAGCDMTTFPAHVKADLSRFIVYKQQGKYVKKGEA